MCNRIRYNGLLHVAFVQSVIGETISTRDDHVTGTEIGDAARKNEHSEA